MRRCTIGRIAWQRRVPHEICDRERQSRHARGRILPHKEPALPRREPDRETHPAYNPQPCTSTPDWSPLLQSSATKAVTPRPETPPPLHGPRVEAFRDPRGARHPGAIAQACLRHRRSRSHRQEYLFSPRLRAELHFRQSSHLRLIEKRRCSDQSSSQPFHVSSSSCACFGNRVGDDQIQPHHFRSAPVNCQATVSPARNGITASSPSPSDAATCQGLFTRVIRSALRGNP